MDCRYARRVILSSKRSRAAPPPPLSRRVQPSRPRWPTRAGCQHPVGRPLRPRPRSKNSSWVTTRSFICCSCCPLCCRTTITPRAGRGLGQTTPPIVQEGEVCERKGRCSERGHTSRPWRPPAATSKALGRTSLPAPLPQAPSRPHCADPHGVINTSPSLPGSPLSSAGRSGGGAPLERCPYLGVCSGMGRGKFVVRAAGEGPGSSRARAARRRGGWPHPRWPRRHPGRAPALP